MPDDRLPPRSVLLRALLFVAALLGALILDPVAARWAADLTPAVVSLGLFITTFGVSTYMFVVAGLIAVWAFAARRRADAAKAFERLTVVAHRAVFFIGAIACSGLAVQAIKHVVGRARPRMLGTLGPYAAHPFSATDLFASFPSGHTTSAFAAATALGLMVPRARSPLLCCAIVIGLSRIVVGQHYPSDVLSGALLGTLVTLWLARDMHIRGLRLFPARPRPLN